MTKIGKWIVGAIIAASVAPAWAKVSVQSVVDRTQIGVGDSFTLTVSVSSDESVETQEPRAPDMAGFELLNSWQSSSTSQRLVNTSKGMEFEVQRRKDFNYLMAPRKKGTFSIGAFEVVVDGKVYNTQPITLRVADAGGNGGGGRSQRQQQQQQQMQQGVPPGFDNMDDIDKAEEEMFNQLLQRRNGMMPPGGGGSGAQGGGGGAPQAEPQFRSLPTNPNEAFFIQVEVDKTDVYEGEQVTVSWYIYTRGQMETLDRVKFPDLQGFWKEIIEEVPSIQFSEEIVNGVPYKKALLASHALFPIKPGVAVIDEYKIKSRVRVPTQGFGGFSLGPAYEFTKSSQRVKINVKPLPVEGRPKDFSGAVGQFDVHAGVDNTTVPVNQPLSLKVRFEGTGNAKLIELPAIEWPAGVEVYDTKSDAKFFKNGRSYKEFEILLIPRQEGALKIPSISASMFDPQAKKYYTKATQEIELKVEANPNAPVGAAHGAEGAMKPSATASAAGPARGTVLPDLVLTWDRPAVLTASSEPLVWGGLYAFVAIFLAWQAKLQLGWGRRRQSLREILQKRYKKLDQLVRKNDYRAVGAEMTNIFNLVLGSITGQEAAGLELERMLERIPPSLRREHGDGLKKTYEIFQVMSFAPEDLLGEYKQADRVGKEVQKARSLIDKLVASDAEQNEAE